MYNVIWVAGEKTVLNEVFYAVSQNVWKKVVEELDHVLWRNVWVSVTTPILDQRHES